MIILAKSQTIIKEINSNWGQLLRNKRVRLNKEATISGRAGSIGVFREEDAGLTKVSE
jgi:hypothetical protein